MKLSEMKAIAAKRIGGGYAQSLENPSICWCGDIDLDLIYPEQAKFLALAANTYDRLLAVAEAAKEALDENVGLNALEYALNRLEDESK